MPNYCECFLHFYVSDKSSVDDVLAAMKNGDRIFDFDKLIPYPAKWKKADEAYHEWEKGWAKHPSGPGAYEDYCKTHPRPDDGYNHGGYEWCCENWGTKWNAGDVKIVEKDEGAAVISFETAWAPPLPVIDKLAAMFPDIEMSFEYYEMGMAFCGSIRYVGGKRKYEARGEYYGFRGG